jgi:hypothetical protein
VQCIISGKKTDMNEGLIDEDDKEEKPCETHINIVDKDRYI